MPATDPAAIHLAHGAHASPDDGLCLLEAVAWIRGITHTDHPPCVAPILGAYGRALNDCLPDDTRQLLVPFITRLPGTAGDGLDAARLDVLGAWMVRDWAAGWLDAAGLAGHAARLRALVIPRWPAAAADAAADAAAAAVDAAVAASAVDAASAAVAASAAAAVAAADASAASASADAAAVAVDAAAADAASAAAAASASADAAAVAVDAAAAAAASAAAAADLAWRLRDIFWAARSAAWPCARLIAYRAAAGQTQYYPARAAASAALAPVVAGFQAAGVELLDKLISPAVDGG
jgi:hypothetical protein